MVLYNNRTRDICVEYILVEFGTQFDFSAEIQSQNLICLAVFTPNHLDNSAFEVCNNLVNLFIEHVD